MQFYYIYDQKKLIKPENISKTCQKMSVKVFKQHDASHVGDSIKVYHLDSLE